MKNNRTFMVLELIGAAGFAVASVLNYIGGDMILGTAMLGVCVAGVGLAIDAHTKAKAGIEMK